MRLIEAILDANRRAAAGEHGALIPVAEHSGALPLAALTCIDARLNRLLPDRLGLPEEQFIWLRNAGNIVTGPLSSTMRSLALACAVKGAREIAVLGHTDCQVSKTSVMTLLDRLQALGVDRHRLPENLVEYFGLFGSERQNVQRGVDIVRASPLIGAKVPVHGLVIDVATGRLEWVCNGYEALENVTTRPVGDLFKKADQVLDAFAKIGDVAHEELKLPDTKIGGTIAMAHDWLHKAEVVSAEVREKFGQKPPPAPPPKIPPRPGRQ